MLGNKVKELRKKLNMSQVKLSDLSGVSISYIQQIEANKKTNPSKSILVNLAEKLDVSVDYLLDDTEQELSILEEGSTSYKNEKTGIVTVETYGNWERDLKKIDMIEPLMKLRSYAAEKTGVFLDFKNTQECYEELDEVCDAINNHINKMILRRLGKLEEGE